MRNVAAWLAGITGLAFAALAVLLARLAIERARLPYENGRYFDPVDSVVYDEGAIAVYGLLALVCGLLAAAILWRLAGRARRD